MRRCHIRLCSLMMSFQISSSLTKGITNHVWGCSQFSLRVRMQLIHQVTFEYLAFTIFLVRNALTSYIDITISCNCDYALVLFDNVQDGVIACHTILASGNRQWSLDFQPVEDRVHLKIRYLRWQTLRRQAFTCFIWLIAENTERI